MTPENAIFICYRRRDSNPAAHAIAMRLKDAFGDQAVFWDHKDFKGGEPWREKTQRLIPKAKAVVVVMHKDWVSLGVERLKNPTDPVRQELELAAENPDCSIIPVTIDDTRSPTSQDLEKITASLSDGDQSLSNLLANLFARTTVKIRFTQDFEADVHKLIRRLEEIPQVDQIGGSTGTNIGGLEILRPWSILPQRPKSQSAVDAEGDQDASPAKSKRSKRRASDLWILQAKHRAVSLIGRDDDLQNLMDWLDGEPRISARLIIGRAGAGKTRLGFEFLWKIFSLESETWEAGLIKPESLRTLADWNGFRWKKPTVLLLDYAVAVSVQVRQLFLALAHKAQDQGLPPLRILLLEREASADDGWFSDLLEQENSAGGGPVEELFEPPEPVTMNPLDDLSLRRELLRETLQIVHRHAGFPLLSVPPEGENESMDRRLEDEQWKDPLYLMMAALVGASGERNNADSTDSEKLLTSLNFGRIDLAREVARHEKNRLNAFVETEPQVKLLVHMAMFTTLCGGLELEEALKIIPQELEALGLVWPGGPGHLASLLGVGYPAEDRQIAPIEPDVIAEAFVIDTASKDLNSSQQVSMIERAANVHAASVANLLFHAFQNFSNDEKIAEYLLRWIDGLTNSGLEKHPEWLVAIEGVLPDSSVGLRELSAAVTLSLYQAARQKFSGDPNERNNLARLANNLSIRLSAVGSREEALQAAEEAVEIRRELTDRNRDAFLPALASSLNNWATRLSAVGSREEALRAAEEAVEIRRELTDRNRDAFLPALATSLNNWANILSDVGSREEALQAAEQAVKHFRELTDRNRDAFLPALASSLNNWANRLSDVGSREEALQAAEQAVKHYRELSDRNRDAFLPDLASSLSNWAIMLNAVGSREEALQAADEAVKHYRELTERNRDAFLPDLAMSLSNWAIMLNAVGSREEALQAADEAVKHYRELTERNRDAFLPDLAMSLSNWAIMLNAVGSREEALQAAEEAVEIRRELTERNRDAFLPDLAMSLGSLGTAYKAAELVNEASQSFLEGVELLTPEFLKMPQAFGGLILALLRDYVETAESVGAEVETEKLTPVVEKLQQIGLLED